MTALLSRAEAAAILAVPPKTLAAWASAGKGPRFARVGRFTRYRPEDLERWIDEHTVNPALPVAIPQLRRVAR